MMFVKKDKYIVAVVGATGIVGSEIILLLEERRFPVSMLVPLASEESEGERVEFNEKALTIRRLTNDSLKGVDIAFFCAGASQSRGFVNAAVSSGALVIDSSSAFRMETGVPLVVPEVNRHKISGHKGIIASPDCASTCLALVLKPIHDRARVKRVVATILESVSGSGRKAMGELADQTVALLNFRDIEKKAFPHQIAFNCIPQTDAFEEKGYTKEEAGIAREIKKIMEDETIGITTTTVYVPVFRCHSISLNIETEVNLSPNEVRAILSGSSGVIVLDDPSRGLYPMPIDVAGRDDIYVGRIREDESLKNGINIWIVADNIRKGSALNAVQIAEELVK